MTHEILCLECRSGAKPTALLGLIPGSSPDLSDQPAAGSDLRKACRRSWLRHRGDRGPGWTRRAPVERGMVPATTGATTMTPELIAQNHAWDLARTLMTPVVLFKVNEGEYGVLPADDLDDGEVVGAFRVLPLCRGPAGLLNRHCRAACRDQAASRKGSCAAAGGFDPPQFRQLPAAPLPPFADRGGRGVFRE